MIGDDQAKGYQEEIINLPDDTFESRRNRALESIGVKPNDQPEKQLTDAEKLEKANRAMNNQKAMQEFNLVVLQEDVIILKQQNEKIIKAFNSTMRQMEELGRDIRSRLSDIKDEIKKLKER